MTICHIYAAGAGYSTLPAKNHTATIIPATVRIKVCPAKVARGARKPRGGCPGGAATSGAIYATADRAALLSRATRHH